MGDSQDELSDAYLVLRDGRVAEVGTGEPPAGNTGDEVTAVAEYSLGKLLDAMTDADGRLTAGSWR